jgi:hypothetical protein
MPVASVATTLILMMTVLTSCTAWAMRTRKIACTCRLAGACLVTLALELS